MIALAAMAMTFAACSSDNEEPQVVNGKAMLSLHLSSGESTTITRADEGLLPSMGNEGKIYKAWIWVFENGTGDNATPIAFKEENFAGATEGESQIAIPADHLDKDVDIYAIANYESIPTLKSLNTALADANDKMNVKRSELVNAVFGNADFGTTTIQHEVPAGGLPMAQRSIKKKAEVGNKIDITLRRAVSKVRFVFAHPETMKAYLNAKDEDNENYIEQSENLDLSKITITGITLGGVDESNSALQQIPNQECIFPTYTAENAEADKRVPNLPTGVTYQTETFTCTSTTLTSTNFIATDNPLLYTFKYADDTSTQNETAQQYEARLNAAQTATAQTYGLTYLRETDKKITGTISYTVPEDYPKVHTKTFTMNEENDFTRNHCYIVYGYIRKGELDIWVKVQDWDLNKETLDFTEHVTVTEPYSWNHAKFESEQVFNGDRYDHTVIYLNKYESTDDILEVRFKFDTPADGYWVATLVSTSGDSDAMRFVDEEGNVMKKITIAEDGSLETSTTEESPQETMGVVKNQGVIRIRLKQDYQQNVRYSAFINMSVITRGEDGGIAQAYNVQSGVIGANLWVSYME